MKNKSNFSSLGDLKLTQFTNKNHLIVKKTQKLREKHRDSQKQEQHKIFTKYQDTKYQDTKQHNVTTRDKIIQFFHRMKDSNLLSWFERYLAKTQSHFHNTIKKLAKRQRGQKQQPNKIQVKCSCLIASLQYGTYGPVTCTAQNASEALIAAVRTLTMQWILTDKKCKQDIVIRCLKQKDGSTLKQQTDQHILKRGRKVVQGDQKIRLQSQSIEFENKEVEQRKMRQELTIIQNKVKLLKDKLKQQKQIKEDLMKKISVLPVENEFTGSQQKQSVKSVLKPIDINSMSKINKKHNELQRQFKLKI